MIKRSFSPLNHFQTQNFFMNNMGTNCIVPVKSISTPIHYSTTIATLNKFFPLLYNYFTQLTRDLLGGLSHKKINALSLPISKKVMFYPVSPIPKTTTNFFKLIYTVETRENPVNKKDSQ